MFSKQRTVHGMRWEQYLVTRDTEGFEEEDDDDDDKNFMFCFSVQKMDVRCTIHNEYG
jgi:hypothetical protein